MKPRIFLYVVLAVVMIPLTLRRATAQPAAPRVIEITAKKFEFSPATVTLKQGQPVTLRLVSLDRVHGFLVKPFGIDEDIDPAKPTEVTFTPAESGRFTAICDNYCGSGHASMKMVFIVE